MFPNPQDALPLPASPSLERYKKIAKELVAACKSDDEKAIAEWARQWVEGLIRLSGVTFNRDLPANAGQWIDNVEVFARRTLREKCTLTAAQFVIARSHGFESWPKFAKHLQTSTSRFEQAADAIVSGDIETLRRLLREQPDLVRARSTREHGATLLHYVSANGVEGYRQRTPPNIVEIADLLLDAGAEVDATADVYGGGCTALGLTATSVHPEKAGVQEALLQTLLDRGASVDQSIVSSCLENGRPRAAEFLANRGARVGLKEAAGLGRLDLVQKMCGGGRPRPPAAEGGRRHTDEELQEAFRYACAYGNRSVVELLFEKGVDLAAHGGDGQTPLHWAVITGHLEIVKFILQYHPPLEAMNMYGGTVLGQALWSAAQGGDPDRYIAILEALLNAGAKIPERHVPVNPRVDAWLAEHGSRAEAE
jgi:ankyrin repeat protein